jgi:hypothetical protein
MKLWTCPPAQAPSPSIIKIANSLYNEISDWNARQIPPARFAGLELQIAMTFLSEGLGAQVEDNEFWREKCKLMIMRPATEPILQGYWARLSSFKFDPEFLLHCSSILASKRLIIRNKDTVGKSKYGDVQFEPLNKAMVWISDSIAISAQPQFRAILPAYIFARTIMAHPFSDGNGRLARMLIYAALIKTAGLSQPSLALAPTFYRNARYLAQSLDDLSRDGDWGSFYEVFFNVLGKALRTVRHYFDGHAA